MGLCGSKNFVSKTEKLIFNMFINFCQWKESDMSYFVSNSM